MRFRLLTILLIATASLGGCQNGGLACASNCVVVGLYASEGDALAISNGQFGAVPVAFVSQADLSLSGTVVSRSGAVLEIDIAHQTHGWISIDEVPQKMQAHARALPDKQNGLLSPQSLLRNP